MTVNALFSRAVLSALYALALVTCGLSRFVPRRRGLQVRRLAVVGTFYNAGWFRSHVTPLARSGVDEVLLITDQFIEPCERVRQLIPPRWLRLIAGRAFAKGLVLFFAALKHRPEVFMGYHIVPGAVTALVVGRLLGGRVCYQMTGGPIEVDGGGYRNENPVMGRLVGKSALVERLALATVRQFDLVVVRGRKARAYLLQRGVRGRIAIIPGSVGCPPWRAFGEREHDLVFVGRLTEIKQPLQYVEIIAAACALVPSLKAIVVGDGPLAGQIAARALALQVSDRLLLLGRQDTAESYLAASRIFVLTSRSEGLSIAMAEAMAAGAVPVVADVGELGDLVEQGSSGWLIEPNNIGQYAQAIVGLLRDEERWRMCSLKAREAAMRYAGVAAVAGRWAAELGLASPEARGTGGSR